MSASASSDVPLFQVKCECASHSPGIRVPPRPSTIADTRRRTGRRRATDRGDVRALDEDLAVIRLRTGAVQNANVGERRRSVRMHWATHPFGT